MIEELTPDAWSRPAFSKRWIVLRDAGGEVPPVVAFAHVAKAMRDTLMARWTGPAPEAISGHALDGSPSQHPHLAVVPLATLSGTNGVQRLMGLALVLPEGSSQELYQATLMAVGAQSGNRKSEVIDLTFGDRGAWSIEITQEPYTKVLDPSNYFGPASTWESLTPLILDRFPKIARGLTVEAIIRNSCLSSSFLGLRTVAIRGCRPKPAEGSSRTKWCVDDWSIPLRRDGRENILGTRLKFHVTLDFAQSVSGPMLIGSGRYMGLGLLVPRP